MLIVSTFTDCLFVINVKKKTSKVIMRNHLFFKITHLNNLVIFSRRLIMLFIFFCYFLFYYNDWCIVKFKPFVYINKNKYIWFRRCFILPAGLDNRVRFEQFGSGIRRSTAVRRSTWRKHVSRITHSRKSFLGQFIKLFICFLFARLKRRVVAIPYKCC